MSAAFLPVGPPLRGRARPAVARSRLVVRRRRGAGDGGVGAPALGVAGGARDPLPPPPLPPPRGAPRP